MECLPCAKHSAKPFLLLFYIISLSKSITNLQLITLVKNATFSQKILSRIMQFSGLQTRLSQSSSIFKKLEHFIRIIMINLPFITAILWEGTFQHQKDCSVQTSKLCLFSFPQWELCHPQFKILENRTEGKRGSKYQEN